MSAKGILGRKLGMTQIWDDENRVVPVTVIEAGPCRVVQVREGGVQLGFGARRASRTSKAALGHAKKAGLETAPQVLRVFTVNGEAPAPGAEVKVDIFTPGELVKVTGTTKGRGFQGVVHRYHFGGSPATHGNTRHRKPGSISPGTDPSRVIKGKRMPGHMGAARHTELGLTVVKVDAERNLLFVRGAIPGARNGIVTVAKQGGPSRHD
jgi:large subunit ribosomal protein L3